MTPTRSPAGAARAGRAARRAAMAAVGVVGVVAVALAGCSAGGEDPTPTPAPSAGATRATDPPTAAPSPTGPPLPDVPVRAADLAAVTVADRPAPTRLRLDALGIDIPLDAVGVAEDGQMEIPPMAERGGWYRFGATPGDPAGTVVVAAHVDSVASAGLGPFAALRDARPGQTAVVDLADGTQVTYAVALVTTQPKAAVTWSDVFDRDGPARLVLVTCGGTWRSAARSYSDNVLVTAVPADG